MTSYSFCLYQIEQLQQCQSVTGQGDHLQKWSKGFALFLGASDYLAINEQHCSVSARFVQNSEQRQCEVPHAGQRIWSGFRNGILREKMVLRYCNWFGKRIRWSLLLLSWKMQVPINYTDDAIVKLYKPLESRKKISKAITIKYVYVQIICNIRLMHSFTKKFQPRRAVLIRIQPVTFC